MAHNQVLRNKKNNQSNRERKLRIEHSPIDGKKRDELIAQIGNLQTASFPIQQVSSKNCENLVGVVDIPVGLAGPAHISQAFLDQEGLHSLCKDTPVYIPLATTEGALVASTNRGCKAIRESGGASVVVKNNGMSRAPVFSCESGVSAARFCHWLRANTSAIKKITESTSSYLTFLSLQTWIRGRFVYARFVFDTDQAMGMNMVTIALQKACRELISNYNEHARFDSTVGSKVTPNLNSNSHTDAIQLISISGNMCVDKKSSALNIVLGRGRWVQAEVVLTHKVLQEVLKIDLDHIEMLVRSHIAKNLVGSSLSGSFATNMQAANVIAALFTATGQDIAHVVEASQVHTTIEHHQDGIYAAVTIPNLPCGVIGGGTYLPSQTQARQAMYPDLRDQEHDATQTVDVNAFAVAVSVGVLAAELSGVAALTTHTLAQAHQKLGR